MELSSKPKLINLNYKVFGVFTILCGLVIFTVNLFLLEERILLQTIVFSLLSFLAQLIPARLPQGVDYSVAFIIDLVLIALFGMPVAVFNRFFVTVGAGVFSKILGRNDNFYKILKNAGQLVIVVGLAATAFQLVSNQIFGFAVSSVVYFFVNTFMIAIEGRTISHEETFSKEWFTVIKLLYINFFVLSSLAFLLTYITENASSEWKLLSVLLFFVPVLLVSHAFRLSVEIKQSYLNTVKTIAAAIEAKDPYMKGHSQRVSENFISIAREVKHMEKELQKLEYVALLHDAGKIGIADEILNKPGALSIEEYEEVKKHSEIGAEIIRKIKFLSYKSDVVLYHHERFDGSGYPAGLKGEEIPLESRILSVADAYDAMTTDRPFRAAKTRKEAAEELKMLSGSQFDPKIVDIFIKILKKRGEI